MALTTQQKVMVLARRNVVVEADTVPDAANTDTGETDQREDNKDRGRRILKHLSETKSVGPDAISLRLRDVLKNDQSQLLCCSIRIYRKQHGRRNGNLAMLFRFIRKGVNQMPIFFVL